MSTAVVDTTAAAAATAATGATTAAESSAAATSAAATNATGAAVAEGAEATAAAADFNGKSFETIIADTLNKAHEKRTKEEAAATGKEPVVTPASTSDAEAKRLADEQLKANEKTPGETDAAKEAAKQEVTFDLDEQPPTNKWLDDLLKSEKIKVGDDSTRNALHKIVREHGEMRSIAEIFGNDPEMAQEAATNASRFLQLDGLYLDAHTHEGTVGFLRALNKMERDFAEAGGKPILPEGQTIVGQLLTNLRTADLKHYEKLFRETQDQEALDALDILRERMSAGSSPAPEELPPQLAKQKADLDARQKELDRIQSDQRKQAQESFTTKVSDGLESNMLPVVNAALSKAAFAPAIREACEEKIYSRIIEKINSNQLYQSTWNKIHARGPSDETFNSLVAHNMKFFNMYAPEIIRETVREFKDPLVADQAARQAKQAQQENRSRTEPKGAAPPASAVAGAGSGEQFVQQIKADLTAKLGRAPNNSELIDETITRRQAMRRQAGA